MGRRGTCATSHGKTDMGAFFYPEKMERGGDLGREISRVAAGGGGP